MEHSKMQTLSNIEAMITTPDELPHSYCHCQHCKNNTKPKQKPKAPRILSQKQKYMNNAKAYQFILKELTKGYHGKCQAPDVFVISDAALIFQSKAQGRPRIKQHQTNMDAKKHFDEQRRKYINNPPFQLTNSIVTIPEDPNNALSHNKALKQKQVAILTYHDGTEQILTQILLSKTLQKRKNDPSWEGISHLVLIPPEAKHPLSKIRHQYIRSEDILPQLNQIIQKISVQMDSAQEKNLITSSNRSDNKLNSLKLEEQEEMQSSIPFNPENKSQSKTLSTANRKRKNTMESKKLALFFEEVNPEQVKNISIEIVAYIEVTTLIRILQADFEYFTDGPKLYLSNVNNFIYQRLEGTQLKLVHDRYKPLQQISLKQIADQKQSYDHREAEQLWNICSAIVKECLEFRKVQLKLQNYNNPSRQTRLNIFMKIFPEFKVENIFENNNWKNELNSFISNTKSKINKIIREDQGIRILRRFGLNFKRTFN